MILDGAELKQRYRQRIDGVRDNKAYIGPEVVNLHLTNACNLRCHFCMADHSPDNPAHLDKAQFFPFDKFLGVVADAVEMSVDQIILMGSGEPSVHPSFREMLQHLEDKPLKVVLVTNATFPLDYCSEVIKADHVIINLSGVDRQQYLDLKGKDFFDRVIANIERLVALRDAKKPGFIVELAHIVNAVNTPQRQKMEDLATKLRVNWVDFKKMEVHEYNQDIALPEDLEPEERRTPPQCLNGWFYMLVVAGGNFSFCYKIPQMHPADLEKWSLKQYWFSANMNKIRLLGKLGRIQQMYEACQTCPFYEEHMGLKENEKFWRPARAKDQLFMVRLQGMAGPLES